MDETAIKLSIDNLILKLFKQRFINEVNSLDGGAQNILRNNMLTRIVHSARDITLTQEKYSYFYNPNLVDEIQFRKKWKSLNRDQKLQKILEYVENIFTHEPLIKEVSQMFKNIPNKLCGEKHVTYDINSQSILYIKCISLNKKNEIVIQ